MLRKHRLAERLLSDVIGLDWEFVHEEACRWEHVMSEQVEERLVEMLGHPTESPYGNPIPQLDDLGASPSARFLEGVVSLVAARPRRATARCRSSSAGSASRPSSTPSCSAQLKATGVVPGARARRIR